MDAVRSATLAATEWLARVTSVPPPISVDSSEMLLVVAATLFLCALVALLHPAWATAMDRSRNVSTLHSLIVVVWAVAVYREVGPLLFQPSGAVWTHSSSFLRMPIAITIGYIAFDSLLGLAFPNVLDPLMMVHHAVVLAANGLSLYSGCGHAYCVLFLINEASTIPLNFHYQWCGKRGGLPRLLNGAALWVLYLTCRMVANALLIWSIAVTSAPAVRAAFPVTWGVQMAVCATLAVLNVNWFYRITLGFVKAVSSGGGPAKRGAASRRPAAAGSPGEAPAPTQGADAGAGAVAAAPHPGEAAASESEVAQGGPARQRRVQRAHA